MVRVVLFIGWLAAAAAAHARANVLTGPAIRHLVSDAILFINTPLNTKIPVRYDADGSLAGVAGGMAFILGAPKDTGRWWVARDRLCHRWTRWFDGDTQCLKLRKTGHKIFWASDNGRTGTAVIRRVKTRKPAQHVAKAKTPVSPNTKKTRVAEIKNARAPTTLQKRTTFNTASLAGSRPVVRRPAAKLGAVKMGRPDNKRGSVKQTASVRKTQSTRAQKVVKAVPAAAKLRQTAWQVKPTFRVANVAAVDVLNIRNGPSEYHPIVGRIPPAGRGVKIIGACQAWWCPVQHRNVRGWVNRFYLVVER